MLAASYESSATAEINPDGGGAGTGRGGAGAGGASTGAGGERTTGLTGGDGGASGAGLAAASFRLAPDRLFEGLDPEGLPDRDRPSFLDCRRLERESARERDRLLERLVFVLSSRTEKF